MFESITFFDQSKIDKNNPLDIGALVECMLFYGKTSVVGDQRVLKQLFIYFGIDRVKELIEENLLNIIYTETAVGVLTNTIDKTECHDVCMFSSPNHTYQDELQKICTEVTGKSGKARRIANRIQSLIKIQNHENIILDGARQLFLNQDYINESAKIIIGSFIPQHICLDGIIFQTEKREDRFIVSTNINFLELNHIYQSYYNLSSSLFSPALLLSYVLNVESELFYSANNLSEIATSGLNANLMAYKINYILDKSIKSKQQIQNFQNLIFGNAKSLREAINNNKIDLDDLLRVLKKSNNFKQWIMNVQPDQDLINSYYNEVTKNTFIDKLPGKYLRWGIFTSIGFIADATLTEGMGKMFGIGLSALDYIYLDKLISGWKPSQFIEDEVKVLLKNK